MSPAVGAGATPWLHRQRRILTLLCALAFVVAFTGTHLPSAQVAVVDGPDKLLHVAGYFCLASSLLLALAARLERRAPRLAWSAGAIAVYGALDELTQPAVGRTASWGDWLANLAGLALALCAVELVAVPLTRRFERRRVRKARDAAAGR